MIYNKTQTVLLTVDYQVNIDNKGFVNKPTLKNLRIESNFRQGLENTERGLLCISDSLTKLLGLTEGQVNVVNAREQGRLL